jgi:hypothetical protein
MGLLYLVVPISCSFVASGIRGATSFGDGITFQMLWALSCAAGLQAPIDAVMLRRGVLLASCMQLLTMPVTLYQARTALPIIAGYAAPMFLFGCVFVYFGANLLISADTHTLRLTAGLFFALLSGFQLLKIGWTLVFARSRASEPAVAPVFSEQNNGATDHTTSAPVSDSVVLAIGSSRSNSSVSAVTVACAESKQCPAEDGQASDSPSVSQRSPPCQLPQSAVADESDHAVQAIPVCVLPTPNHGSHINLQQELAPSAVAPEAGIHLTQDQPHFHSDEHELAPMLTRLPDSASSRSDGQTLSSPAAVSVHAAVVGAPTCFMRWYPALSAHATPLTMLLCLCVAAMVSGLFSGLLGAGGPPVMAVYAFLALDKDILRGFSAVPAGFMCELPGGSATRGGVWGRSE